MTTTPPLPKLPEHIGEIVGVRQSPPNTSEFWGYFADGYKTDKKQYVYTADQIHALLAERDAAWLEALSQRGEAVADKDLEQLYYAATGQHLRPQDKELAFKYGRAVAAWSAPQPAQPAKVGNFEVLQITTAYEQGVGQARRSELSNPYPEGKPTREAWDMGREYGLSKPEPAARPSMTPEYLIRARWPDGIEQYLHVRGVYDLGGTFGIDVDAPECHPLTQPAKPVPMTDEQHEALMRGRSTLDYALAVLFTLESLHNIKERP
jgi:hypothetical protein